MVHYYATAEDLKKQISILKDITNEISFCSKELYGNERELRKVEENHRNLLKEVKIMEEKMKNLKFKKENCVSVLKELNLKKEKRENVIKNTVIIKTIVVDQERSMDLWNGLVSLNRDILLKLIKIIEDETTVRMIIGMAKLFYEWSKHRIFYHARRRQWHFSPRTPPLTGVVYSDSKITYKTEKHKYWAVKVDRDLSRTISGRYYLDVGISGYSFIGVALKSAFPSLQSEDYVWNQGVCVLHCNGVVYADHLLRNGANWNPDIRGNNYERDDTASATAGIELDPTAHTLHFSAKGQQIPVCVTNVPRDVCFVIGTTGPEYGGAVEVKALKLIIATTTHIDVCNEYEWN